MVEKIFRSKINLAKSILYFGGGFKTVEMWLRKTYPDLELKISLEGEYQANFT